MESYKDWYRWYVDDRSVRAFGDTVTYEIVADFLDGYSVEDWGCGYGFYKTLHRGPYRGIDGVDTGSQDHIQDLSTYTSDVDAIMMRAVLEHNYNWRDILYNCATSAKKRLAIVVVTPSGSDETINYVGEAQIPDICIPWDEVTRILKDHGWRGRFSSFNTDTHYHNEAVWLAEKEGI